MARGKDNTMEETEANALLAIERVQELMPLAGQGEVTLHRFSERYHDMILWSWATPTNPFAGNAWLDPSSQPPQWNVSVNVGQVVGDIRTTPDRAHTYVIQVDPREMVRPVPAA